MIRVLYLLVTAVLVATPVWAQSASKAAVELVSTTHSKINGFTAISGRTIFSGNRVSTARQGTAILNLGKLGRMELGAETDLTMRFSDGWLGVELHSGRLALSVPAGVVVSINTAIGEITTNRPQGATLSIKVDSKHARIIAYRGEVRILSAETDKHRYMKEGDEITLDSGSAKSGRVTLPTGSQTPTTWAGLVVASIKYGMAWFISSSNEPDDGQTFDDTITCRDQFRNICHRRGTVSP